MTRVRFTKAHGAGNDFLLSWESGLPAGNRAELARAICARHTGMGADGWLLIETAPPGVDCHAAIRLYNSDGSVPEISGNGTRCAAALLVAEGLASERVKIMTGAGLKELHLASRCGMRFEFEMEMGRPAAQPGEVLYPLPLSEGIREVTLVDAGNPQCAVFVESFDFDWRRLGAEIESHPHFPARTNVSFVRVADRHTLDVRFYERGAGPTLSSGTGSTGAVWAAWLRGLVDSPVDIHTPGGVLKARWGESFYLTGPAVIIGSGEFYWEGGNQSGSGA